MAFASYAGTAIEFYDFYIYGTAAALVFPTVFFPALGQSAGVVAAFATFGVAFVARPVGAAIFGHYGDRLGRKRTLIVTLLMMGFATVAVGLLPSAHQIGVLAPILLTLLRVVQGFAVGGEWAGAALLSAEYAPKGRRGMYGMFTQLGAPTAFMLSTATFLVANVTIGEGSSAFLEWGWRIPFLLSALLIAVGLLVRLSVEETPVFRRSAQERAVAPAPLGELLRTQPGQVVIGAGATTGIFAFFYMASAYLTSYGTAQLGLDRSTVLTVGIVGGAAMAVTTVASALWCDRVGRRPVMMVGFALGAVWALALFPILNAGSAAAFCVGVTGLFVTLGISYGPMGSLLPELFLTRCRYTGAGLAYNFGGILGGAIPPLIAGPLAASFGSHANGVLLSALALVSLVCVFSMRETRTNSL